MPHQHLLIFVGTVSVPSPLAVGCRLRWFGSLFRPNQDRAAGKHVDLIVLLHIQLLSLPSVVPHGDATLDQRPPSGSFTEQVRLQCQNVRPVPL